MTKTYTLTNGLDLMLPLPQPDGFVRMGAHQGLDDREWEHLSRAVEANEQSHDPRTCFQTTRWLAHHLGWAQESGYFTGGGRREGHYWNRKADGTLIDPTYDQFGGTGDPVRVLAPGHPAQAEYQRDTPHEARVKTAPGQKGEEPDGVMVCIVPPMRIIEKIVLEEGEPAENIHLTLAYLGDMDEYGEDHLGHLPEIVAAWCEGQKSLPARVQGAGTFTNPDNHALWASVDLGPDGTIFRDELVRYLSAHGYNVRRDHGFIPHVTLAYSNHHFRFMPKIDIDEFLVREVWACVGPRWESFRLTG